MIIITATLIKTITDDGLLEMWENISLGKKYQIDLDSLEIAEGYNESHNVFWKREIVYTTDGEWLPTELLEFKRTKGN